MSSNISVDWYRKILNQNLFLPPLSKRSKIVSDSYDPLYPVLPPTPQPKRIGGAAIAGITCACLGTVIVFGISIFVFLQAKKRQLRKKDSEKDLVGNRDSNSKPPDNFTGDEENPPHNFSSTNLSTTPVTANSNFLNPFQPIIQLDLNMFNNDFQSTASIASQPVNNESNHVPITLDKTKESPSGLPHSHEHPQLRRKNSLSPLSDEVVHPSSSSSNVSSRPGFGAKFHGLVPHTPLNSPASLNCSLSQTSKPMEPPNERLTVPSSTKNKMKKTDPNAISGTRSSHLHQAVICAQMNDCDRESPVLGLINTVKINRSPCSIHESYQRLGRKMSEKSKISINTFE